MRKGESEQGAAGMTFTHQQDVQVLNQDIRHIITTPAVSNPGRNRLGRRGRGAVRGGPLSFLGLALIRRRRAMEHADVIGTRRKRALRQPNVLKTTSPPTVTSAKPWSNT